MEIYEDIYRDMFQSQRQWSHISAKGYAPRLKRIEDGSMEVYGGMSSGPGMTGDGPIEVHRATLQCQKGI